MPKLKTIWRVFSYLKRYPRLAISTLGCAIASTVLVVVFPGATRYILNDVVSGHPSEHLVLLVTVVAIAMLLNSGLDYLRLLLNTTFEQNVIFDLRHDLYSHIQTLPVRWFDNRATGDVMTRILEDVGAVEQVLIDIYKLGKDGGTLLNKINSIAESNPIYAQAIQREIAILRSVGYDIIT